MDNKFEHLLPETIFDSVERLGGRCTGRFLALNAMENRVYSVEMEEGETRIIKFYRPGRWDRDNLLAEHEFLKALVIEEVPAVPPIADDAGETLFEWSDGFFAVFPKRPGRLEPELNPVQLERLGRFLARIHQVGASFRDVKRPKLSPQTFGRDSLQFLIDDKVIPEIQEKKFSQLVTEICDLLEPRFAGTESILLHGDCHNGNVLWNGDNPFIIDFDDMLYGPPVQDIWMLTHDDEMRADLLDSYEEIRDFDHLSLKLIEALRTLRIIYFSAWIGRRREDGAFKATFPAFGTERYWQEQIETLSVQLEKLRS